MYNAETVTFDYQDRPDEVVRVSYSDIETLTGQHNIPEGKDLKIVRQHVLNNGGPSWVATCGTFADLSWFFFVRTR